jgi:heme-degrading monooxygenase HmoA
MIQRSWRARATAAGAHEYAEHLTGTVLPKLRELDGFVGLVLSRRRQGDDVQLVVQTYWTSMEAIHGFAGLTPEVAVVEPAAEAALLSFDSHVEHHDVLLNTFGR